MDLNEAKKNLEALLFASARPVTTEELGNVLEEDFQQVRQWIEELKKEYEDGRRGLAIVELAGGWQMATHSSCASYLKKLFSHRFSDKLSKPAMETLAIIAYKQPIPKSDIEFIRGVNVEGALHTLLERSLVRVVGRRPTPGRPLIYGTTKLFLERFGLSSVEELPNLEEFKETDLELAKSENISKENKNETGENTQEG